MQFSNELTLIIDRAICVHSMAMRNVPEYVINEDLTKMIEQQKVTRMIRKSKRIVDIIGGEQYLKKPYLNKRAFVVVE